MSQDEEIKRLEVPLSQAQEVAHRIIKFLEENKIDPLVGYCACRVLLTALENDLDIKLVRIEENFLN